MPDPKDPYPLRFSQAIFAGGWGKHLPDKFPKSKACHRALTAYCRNVIRADELAQIPGHAFLGGYEWRKCMELAMRATGATDDKDINLQRTALGAYLSRKAERPDVDAYALEFNIAAAHCEPILSREEHTLRPLHTILELIVIQAWTAFEVLAEQLLRGVWRERPALDSKATWSAGEQKKAGFRSRSRISNYYRFTFRKNNKEIMRCLDNPHIHALAILRNVLVHSAGLIDKAFRDDRKGFDIYGTTKLRRIPSLGKIRVRAIGRRITLSGPLVRYYVDAVTPLGIKLAKAVDAWLIAHP